MFYAVGLILNVRYTMLGKV